MVTLGLQLAVTTFKCVGMDDASLISETDSGIEVTMSNGSGGSHSIVYVRFSVPTLNIQV